MEIKFKDKEVQKTKKKKCYNCGELVSVQIYANLKEIPTCPKCGVLYPEKPELEARLTILQDKYLETRSQEDLNKLFEPLSSLTFNIICNKLKHSAKKEDREVINEMVQWSLIKLLTYYKEKPWFKIEGSFVGYIGQVVLYPLYNKKDKQKQEKEISIFTPIGNDSSSKEMTILDKLAEETEIDGSSNSEEFLFKDLHKQSVIDETNDFIQTSVNTLFKVRQKQKSTKSFTDSLQLALLFNHYMNRKTDRFFSYWWQTTPLDVYETFDKCVNLLKENLYRSAMEG